jgi:peroxiredoxin
MALTFTPIDELGNSCPDFTLPGMDGKTYSLSDFPKGTPLVVMFICNHCPYVKAIEVRLIQLGADLKKQNVPVIAICSNDEEGHPEDSFAELKRSFEEKHYTFHYLHDKSQEVAHKFGAVCTPDYFVYDKDHQLAYRGRLDDSWKDGSKVTKRELYDAVQVLLKGETISEQQTPSMGCSIKWK